MSSSPPPPPQDLLDEYWFFSNTLANISNKPPPRSPAKDREPADKGSSSSSAGGRRSLLRAPSLPPPRPRVVDSMEMPKDDDDDPELVAEHAAAGSGSCNQQPQVEVEVDDDDLNWSSIYEGVLRARMAEGAGATSSRRSALRRAPSMPVPSSAATDHDHRQTTKSTPSSGERRRPEVRSLTLSASQQQQPVLARSRSVFQDKKWRSSSDLESIEVQGFRDLGFVFDKEESLDGVLLGLKQAGGRSSRRPPALVRVQSSEARSAAEMKDQLRMWAQAVACNVRQDCSS